MEENEIDLEEEILEEEESELPNLPVSPIDNIPQPEIVEENVKVQTDGRNFSDLSNYEKIKFAAAQNGVVVKKPNTTCKHCYGTGVISTKKVIDPAYGLSGTSGDTSGIDVDSLIEEIPNPCRCIFHKADIPKMFTGKVPLTRKLERLQFKTQRIKKLQKSTSFKFEQLRLAKKKKAKKKSRKKMNKKFNKR
jgi:hypothetical protein